MLIQNCTYPRTIKLSPRVYTNKSSSSSPLSPTQVGSDTCNIPILIPNRFLVNTAYVLISSPITSVHFSYPGFSLPSFYLYPSLPHTQCPTLGPVYRCWHHSSLYCLWIIVIVHNSCRFPPSPSGHIIPCSFVIHSSSTILLRSLLACLFCRRAEQKINRRLKRA